MSNRRKKNTTALDIAHPAILITVVCVLASHTHTPFEVVAEYLERVTWQHDRWNGPN